MAKLWETIASAPADRVLFLCGETPVMAGEIVATADLNIDMISDTRGPVCLNTESAAMFLVGMIICARLKREVVCPAHLGGAYLNEIGVGDGVFVTDTAVDLPEARRLRPGSRPAAPATMSGMLGTPLRMTFFTSGSSGTPKAVERTLDQLEAEALVLESLWGGVPGPVLGSVSHQHIYGIGFRIVWPVMARRPSADFQYELWDQLCDRLVPGSVFVSSPTHLTRLPGAGVLSQCRPGIIFSAGGLLPFEVARQCEAMFGQVPIEVLGSTETSGVAWRQQRSSDELWTPLPGVEVVADAFSRLTVKSSFIDPDRPITLGDRIEIVGRGRFRLLGRTDRVAKVEGMRVSLTRVEEALADLEEVDETAVVALPHRRGWLGAAIVLSPKGVSRLAEQGAFRLSRRLRGALAGHLDPVERPKFWRFVPRLPMNSLGKRIDADVRALFEIRARKEPKAPGVHRLEDPLASNLRVAAQ